MKQTLTAKIQVFPDSDQKALLSASMDAFRAACNFVSMHVYDTRNLSASSLNRELYREIRSRFGLPSQMTQSAIRSVIGSYRSMKSNGRWEPAEFGRAFTVVAVMPLALAMGSVKEKWIDWDEDIMRKGAYSMPECKRRYFNNMPKLDFSGLRKPLSEEECEDAMVRAERKISREERIREIEDIEAHPEHLLGWDMDITFDEYARRVRAGEYD